MQVNDDLRMKILHVCGEAVRDCDTVSVCIYGSQASGYARKDSDFDVLFVVDTYDEKVRYYYKTIADKQFAILAVDKRALELDAEKGELGDFVAGRFLSPYIPVVNPDYLRKIEITVKRRFAEEDLEDLIIEYDELSRGLVIEPEYLVLARMEKRSIAYPPLKYSYTNMLQKNLRESNMKKILDGYREVIEDLVSSGMVKREDESIILVDRYIDKVLSSKIRNRVVNLMDFGRRAIHSYLTHTKAGKVNLDIVAKELASKIKREIHTSTTKMEIEDPKNYLLLKTEQGLISLNRKDMVIDKIRSLDINQKIDVSVLSGALNDVHLVTLDDEMLVVKKFTDWFNIKWLLLNIASYGTKVFRTSGKARLSNEYVTNRILAEKGIPVPEVVSISLQDRILVEQYIKGKSLLHILLKIGKSDQISEEDKKYVFAAGKLLAQIHNLDVTVGDCKPENFIAGDNGKIYVIDLEQGERKGDKAWDVAEFLYMAGHFGIAMAKGFLRFTRCFVSGYASVGDKTVLNEAGGVRYTRVFVTWTPISIIQEISTILRAA